MPNPSYPSPSAAVTPLTALISTLGLNPHASNDLIAAKVQFVVFELAVIDS